MSDEENNVIDKLTEPTQKITMEPKRKAAFDDLLKFGRYTKYLTVVFFLLLSVQSFQLLFMSFAGAKPVVESVDCGNATWTGLPVNKDTFGKVADFCKKVDELKSQNIVCDLKLKYKYGSVHKTLGVECQPDYVTYSTSIQHSGLIFGTLISGYFANSIGRKKTLIADLCLLATCLVLSTFAKDVVVFTIIRFLIMMCAAGSHNVAHLFIIENLAPKLRSIIPTYLSYPVGFLMTAIVAKFAGDWITLTYANAAITLLPIILLFFVVETPSFLFGRANAIQPAKKTKSAVKLEAAGEDATETLLKQQEKACRRRAKEAALQCDTFLGSRKSPDFEEKWKAAAVQQRINEIASKMAAADSPPPKASCIGRVFSSPLFGDRRLVCFTAILSYCIIVLSTTTYGVLMGISRIPGEIWENIALSAVASYLFNWVAISAELICGKLGHPLWAGRRQLHIGFASATICLLVGLLFLDKSGNATTENPGWQWVLRLLAWSIVGTCTELYIVHHVQSSETFPTPVRAVGCSIVQTCSRLGNAFGPLVNVTRERLAYLPSLIMVTIFTSELLLYINYSFGLCGRKTEEQAVIRETKGKPKPEFMPSAGKNFNDYLDSVKLTEDDLAEFDES